MNVKGRNDKGLFLVEGVKQTARNARRIATKSTEYVLPLLYAATPFLFLTVGEMACSERGYAALGGEYFLIAPLWLIILAVIKNSIYRKKLASGMPVPVERFTTVVDGEVTVEYDKLNDMLLYVSDLEDWIESEGL